MATCSTTFLVGGTARIEFRPEPDEGIVDLADVEIMVRSPDGTEQSLSPITEEGDNWFSYDFPIPDAGPRGKWRVRATSSSPSPVIAVESSFTVRASVFENP